MTVDRHFNTKAFRMLLHDIAVKLTALLQCLVP